MDTGMSLIQKRMVHKIKDENVFLCNLRRILPDFIEKETYEHAVKDRLSKEDYATLNRFYTAFEPAFGEQAGHRVYAPRFMPAIQTLKELTFQKLLDQKKMTWEKNLIRALYDTESKNGQEYHVLKRGISEPYDNYLVFGLQEWKLFLNSEERMILSHLFEKVPELEKQNIFFANMFVNTTHPYFFEHPYDHVPSLMLIETVKQFVLACGHTFGKVPVEDTHIIVDAINCRFINFINKNFPVLFKSTTLNQRVNRLGRLKYQEALTEVFQGNKCLAEFKFSGNVIGSELFRTIREDETDSLRQSRFIPLHKENYKLELIEEGAGKKMSASLLNLSLEGMSVRLNDPESAQGNGVMNITLDCGTRGKVNGKYQKIWHTRDHDHIVIGLKSIALGEKDLETLHCLICDDCLVKECREY